MMLPAQIRQTQDQHLLLDLGCFIHAIVVRMRSDFRRIEWLRARSLGDLLATMQQSLRHRADAEACAAVCQVATVLLWNRQEVEDPLPDVLDELRAVRAAEPGVMHFAGGREIDWAMAVPRGAYAKASEDQELAGLFRATVYLRCHLDRFAPQQRGLWQRALAEAQDTEAWANLRRTDAALALLFGTAEPPMPGLPGPVELRDVQQLLRMAGEPADPWTRLDTLFTRVSAPAPRTVREAVLELAHTLVGEGTGAELLQAMAPGQWRRKWADCAAYAYVGMRELDCLMSPVGIEPFPFRPRVLVEPVPRSWQALRRVAALGEGICHELTGRPGFYHLPAIDDAIAALSVQSRGGTLDQALEERLRGHLLASFEQDGPASEVTVTGIDGQLRRTGPHLVRLPLRTGGRTVQALAFRLLVEHEDGAGVFRPPPWGVELWTEALK